MKYMRIVVIAAGAVGILTAFFGAAPASGSVLCTEKDRKVCPTAKVYNKRTHGKLTFSTIKGKSATFETTAGEVLDTCTGSSLSGSTESVGGEGVPVSEAIEEETWEGCTFTTTTVGKGELLVEDISETDNGTMSTKGTEVTINTVLFGSCIYGSASAVDVGTLVGGTEATMSINAVIAKKSGGIGCPSDVRWKDEKVHTDNMGHPLWVSPATD